MTDPRITECAKALKLKAREIGLPVALTADQAADLAQACALAWLKQRPTGDMIHMAEMMQASAFYAGVRREHEERVYSTMNAQAIKEIG